MSLLNHILVQEQWIGYYEYLANAGRLCHGKEYDLFKFIRDREFMTYATDVLQGKPLSYPKLSLISKVGTEKRRTVYTYSREENYMLRLITHMLIRKYDNLFADNLYSFRANTGAKEAIKRIINTPDIESYYSYKVDISDYFNSIDVDRLLRMLEVIFRDDTPLYQLMHSMLTSPYVYDNGAIIEQRKGVMAGTPTAVFLANIYLMDMDAHFEREGVLYCRYSDDIIIFAESEAEINQHKATIARLLEEHGLSINTSKEQMTRPHEEWTFLGFAYRDGDVDISKIALEKLKAKMRRKVRSIYRWRIRRDKSADSAAKVLIDRFNKKLYATDDIHETNWSRWYFPLITTDRRLKEVDSYMQECIRYVMSGRHTKANYNTRYEQLKGLGYTSLVHTWHSWRRGEIELHNVHNNGRER